MMKSLMAGTAALLILAGTASAQVLQETTKSVTTPNGYTESTTKKALTNPSADADFHASTTKRTTRSDGTQIETKQNYTAGADGTKANASFRATNPDGSEIKTEQNKVTTPTGASTTTNTTTEIKP